LVKSTGLSKRKVAAGSKKSLTRDFGALGMDAPFSGDSDSKSDFVNEVPLELSAGFVSMVPRLYVGVSTITISNKAPARPSATREFFVTCHERTLQQ
jgi:hypothetical protein